MASMEERCTMCKGSFGARGARETISAMAYVSNDGGRESRMVWYESSGPVGASGGSECCTSSPTEAAMGGIISA